MKTNAAAVTIAALVLIPPPSTASAEGVRALELRLESLGVPEAATIQLEAGARYVIERVPKDERSASSAQRPAVEQDSPEKLIGAVAGSDRQAAEPEPVTFTFAVRRPAKGEMARFEVPVRYTISMVEADGNRKSLSRSTTFVVPDDDPSELVARCIRVQAFPDSQQFRVGIAPCGGAWTSP